jgi:hypothetical protein
MTRSRLLLTVLLVGTGSVFFAGTGCSASGVGDPCIPEQEYNEQFLGFSQKEVNVESKSFQCQTRVCLVNHFQGRTSCPYGGTNCTVPGTDKKPTASDGSAIDVKAACSNRAAAKAVYCSCRCANVEGKTDDGANYCKCGDGYTCTQLVGAVGAQQLGLTGAYCIKAGTDYSDDDACVPCDKDKKDCGSDNGK